MALACSLLKLNPKLDMKIKSMLSESKSYIYEEKRDGELRQQLKLYIENIKTNEFGKSCDIFVDEPRVFWNKDEGNRFIKTTKKLEIQLYSTNKLENYLAIFSSRHIVKSLVSSISKIIEDTNWFLPLSIDINSK